MRWIAVTLFFVTSLCYAKRCPDPRLQQAVIGGDTIDGWVLLHHKPLKFAAVRLYFSTGKTAWAGRTGKDGSFHITHLQPDAYRLNLKGWGSTTIRLSPDLTKLSNGQTVFYSVQLMEDECVATSSATN